MLCVVRFHKLNLILSIRKYRMSLLYFLLIFTCYDCGIIIFSLGDNIVFLYPDMETVLIGRFENETMVAAKPSKVLAERCHQGIKEIRVARPKVGAPIFKHDRPNRIRIGGEPTTMDPFERKNVFIQDGKKEDGMFAKENIIEGDLFMYYSGIIWNQTELPLYSSNQTWEDR